MSLLQGLQGQAQSHGKLFNNLYLGKKKISSGSFGVVYLGQNVRSKEYCAIKVEKSAVDDLLSLEREVQILKQIQNIPQVPKLHWSGQEGTNNVMVIQLLGHDLTHYLKIYKKFSLKCVLNIADQMLTVLEAIHKKSVLHRDIKPENILTGRDTEQMLLYLVDYGISKFYREAKGQHISFKENKPFIGTTRYAPIAAHLGHELSRKDDLESLGYMLIYLLKGQLPWQSLQSSSEEEKIKIVGQMKQKLDTNELCKDTPVEFARYMDFVRKLSFKAQPDYKYLQQLFKRLSQNSQFSQQDRKFDWSDLQPATKSQDTFFKKPNRKSSADPSSLLINQVDSSKLVGKVKDIGSQFNRKNDNELQSNHSNGPSSYLRLPDQRYSQLGSSLLTLDRNGDRRRSVASFNSFASSQGPEGSVLVGFQPSMQKVIQTIRLGTIVNQMSYNSNQSGGSGKNWSSINYTKLQSNGLSNIEMSPQQFGVKQLQPIAKKQKSEDLAALQQRLGKKQFMKEVTTDSKDGYFQELPDRILDGDMVQSVQMSQRAQKDLNCDEDLNLTKRMAKLGSQSVSKYAM